jgi:hypothetical protein
MKKSNIIIKLISLRLKFPTTQSSRIYYDNKLDALAFNSAFEADIQVMSTLKDRWAEYGWIINASACILGLLYLIKKIIF